jgi:hypothetical protein
LQVAIARKAPPGEVGRLTKSLKEDLLAAYPVSLAPTEVPDVSRGAALYVEQCASCHGAAGAGDGPAAKVLVPPPVTFSDATRARSTQFFGLSSILIAMLAVVLAGKGVAALQEAGRVDIWPMPGVPRVEWLGIYPTRERVRATRDGRPFWFSASGTPDACALCVAERTVPDR